jgi:hypothetical protein
MDCPRCRTENRDGSNFCRYCAAPLSAGQSEPTSGYIPSVPPPAAQQYPGFQTPPSFETPPQPPARRVVAQRLCPRCSSPQILKGTTPVWAVVLSIVTFPIFCFLSLFFLLIKDPCRCLQCGFRFK